MRGLNTPWKYYEEPSTRTGLVDIRNSGAYPEPPGFPGGKVHMRSRGRRGHPYYLQQDESVHADEEEKVTH